MKKKLLLTGCVVFLSACVSHDNYSGSGGMTKYSVKSNAYLYHYENGFTKEDAMGWDPNLQYAWSRVGAAMTCGVPFDKSLILKQMASTYGNNEIVHDMNGIQFHSMQSAKITDFCTPERLREIKEVIPKFSQGDFPNKY